MSLSRRLLFLDHRDSFSGNLIGWFRHHGWMVDVIEVSERGPISDTGVSTVDWNLVVLGPGPGDPSRYRWTREFLLSLPEPTRCVGVCLGMQIMLDATGVTVGSVPCQPPVHGRVVELSAIAPSRLLGGALVDGRMVLYNSLGALDSRFPSNPTWSLLSVAEGCAMAVEHRHRPWLGVQFHPESFASPGGEAFLRKIVPENN